MLHRGLGGERRADAEHGAGVVRAADRAPDLAGDPHQSRDELGISQVLSARPVQAALASAGTFSVGAVMPLLAMAIAPGAYAIPVVAGTSLGFLAILGGLAAVAGGASAATGAMRVAFWGALAMAITAGVGAMFGTVA